MKCQNQYFSCVGVCGLGRGGARPCAVCVFTDRVSRLEPFETGERSVRPNTTGRVHSLPWYCRLYCHQSSVNIKLGYGDGSCATCLLLCLLSYIYWSGRREALITPSFMTRSLTTKYASPNTTKPQVTQSNETWQHIKYLSISYWETSIEWC